MNLSSIVKALRARARRARKEKSLDPYRKGLNDGLVVAYEVSAKQIERWMEEVRDKMREEEKKAKLKEVRKYELEARSKSR